NTLPAALRDRGKRRDVKAGFVWLQPEVAVAAVSEPQNTSEVRRFAALRCVMTRADAEDGTDLDRGQFAAVEQRRVHAASACLAGRYERMKLTTFSAFLSERERRPSRSWNT